MSERTLVIGTRKSPLALWQTEHVKHRLQEICPGLGVDIRKVVTLGDKSQTEDMPLPEIGGKGLFTAELEQQLASEVIDLAVHSLKDLPTKIDQLFTLGAILERHSPEDVLISRNRLRLEQLPLGAVVGTSSVRRAAQLLRMRPDLIMRSIRGNIGTRISKLKDPEMAYDAIVLAKAGLDRLGYSSEICQKFTEDEILPAPGQGAMAIQCRSQDAELCSILAQIDSFPSRAEVLAERAFLVALDAGCNTPVGCRAWFSDGGIRFLGRCLSPDGRRKIEVSDRQGDETPEELGARMARQALQKGFQDL